MLANGGPTALDYATLGIAVVALAASAAAIGVQIGQFVLAGGRAKVSLHRAAIGSGSIVTGPPDGDWLEVEGHPTRAIGVRVRNVGRLPVVVESWSVEIGGGVSLGQVPAFYNEVLPATIEPGATKTWYLAWDDLDRAIRATIDVLKKETSTLTGVVGVGDGSTKRTKPSTAPTASR